MGNNCKILRPANPHKLPPIAKVVMIKKKSQPLTFHFCCKRFSMGAKVLQNVECLMTQAIDMHCMYYSNQGEKGVR